jgi:NAD(P)-dependent dehydrogenase (short-subunit alcohol dehydrogenase family)
MALLLNDEERLDDAFDEIFQVNVKSQLVCVKAALAELRPGITGTIVHSNGGTPIA